MSIKPQDRIHQQSKPWLRAGRRTPANKPRFSAKGVFSNIGSVPQQQTHEAQPVGDVYQAPAQVIIDQGDGKTLHIHVAGTLPITQPWFGPMLERRDATSDEDRAIEETDRALAQVAANVEVMRRDQQEINQLRAETRVLLHQLGVA